MREREWEWGDDIIKNICHNKMASIYGDTAWKLHEKRPLCRAKQSTRAAPVRRVAEYSGTPAAITAFRVPRHRHPSGIRKFAICWHRQEPRRVAEGNHKVNQTSNRKSGISNGLGQVAWHHTPGDQSMGRPGSPSACLAIAGLATQVVQGLELFGIRLGRPNYPSEKRIHPACRDFLLGWRKGVGIALLQIQHR